jgi:hypothetical protein
VDIFFARFLLDKALFGKWPKSKKQASQSTPKDFSSGNPYSLRTF